MYKAENPYNPLVPVYTWQKMEEIKEYILSHIESPLRELHVVILAKKTGVSKTVILHCFKLRYGVKVHQYIRQLRMQHIMGLISDPDLSVIEIAEKMGYENMPNFYRDFKSFHGLTPLQAKKTFFGSKNFI
jgi:AraC-like DNA-binding protein